MNPVSGARLTLITKDVQTPYSGMLPGYVSGFYSFEDVHIDLRRLAKFAGSRLIKAEAIGLDTQRKEVILRDRPPIKYNVLSIDIGSSPDGTMVPGAREYTTAVKPISTFISRLNQLLDTLKNKTQSIADPSPSAQIGNGQFSLVVVGGGAGGVELAFALKYRLTKETEKSPNASQYHPSVKLVTKKNILEGYPAGVRETVLKLFKEKDIEVRESSPVSEVQNGELILEKGDKISFDGCLWCTQASAASWLKSTSLETDEKGFIQVNSYLQPINGPPEIFAAGDVATSVPYPTPKAGVFAVRQGPFLASNLRSILQGEPLKEYIPQATFLSLISTGDKYCVASKGWFRWQGQSMWTWKDRIDRAFMDKYGDDLPDMMPSSDNSGEPERLQGESDFDHQMSLLMTSAKMRCGGCGGKIGKTTLNSILRKINSAGEGENLVYDDAAVLDPAPKGHRLLQTTDFLKSFIDDPFLFGQITAVHCLSDIYAMGGRPTSLLATPIVPFSAEEVMKADLLQIMLGVKKVCDETDCKISGGHTAEGHDLALGLSVIGTIHENKILTKTGCGLGQSLILTKPLGTGTILAAEMRGKAKAPWIQTAIDSMLVSNRAAGDIFLSHGATACTDVTGYGLLGHLAEMIAGSGVSVEVDIESIPALEGSEECIKNQWLSSLHSQNIRVQSLVENFDDFKSHLIMPLLVDPQTSGGLIAFVPERSVEDCLKDLKSAGLSSAVVIGKTTGTGDAGIHKFNRQETVSF